MSVKRGPCNYISLWTLKHDKHVLSWYLLPLNAKISWLAGIHLKKSKHQYTMLNLMIISVTGIMLGNFDIWEHIRRLSWPFWPFSFLIICLYQYNECCPSSWKIANLILDSELFSIWWPSASKAESSLNMKYWTILSCCLQRVTFFQ